MPLEFSTDWLTPHLPVWEAHLAGLRGEPGLRVLEVGCFEGRSACWFLHNLATHPSARVTCVDPFDLSGEYGREFFDTMERLGRTWPTRDIEARFDANIRAVGGEGRVIKRKGRSQDILPSLPPRSQDVVYIDGSHASAAVLTDAVLCWPLLRHRGVLVFDDYTFNLFPESPLRNPAIGIDAFLSAFADQYETLERGAQVLIRKASSDPATERPRALARVQGVVLQESSRPA